MAAKGHYGHYDVVYCGGIQPKSGKGAGPRHGGGQRHQKVLAYPAWGGKKGCDVYFSSRWDDSCQIYDWYWTPKNMAEWSWKTREWEWVYIQELPFDEEKEDFVWAVAKNRTNKKLKGLKHNRMFQQKAEFYAGR